MTKIDINNLQVD